VNAKRVRLVLDRRPHPNCHAAKIDFEDGIVLHEGNEYHFSAFPLEVLVILEEGGLIPHVRKELGKE